MVRTVIGAILLAVAAGASLMLSLHHLVGMTLPGCGVGSACASAAASVWGKVPGINWPTSFVGLSYFLALEVAWLWTGGQLRSWLNGIVFVGGAGSITLIAAMFAGGYVCEYCMAVHAANLLFVGVVAFAMLHEPATAAAGNSGNAGAAVAKQGLVPFSLVFVVAAIALTATESAVNKKVEDDAERALDESVQQMTQHTKEPEPFTGRYLLGPENAPIRIVIFSDFQCVDCKRIEGELREIMAERTDVSISPKNFPMCTDCNKHMQGRNMHKNACWAARAAEAAGILRGNDGFWQMHHWLFDKGGGFYDNELNAALQSMGYDVKEFTKVMMGPETLARVQEDIEEAISLGIFYTPMIFINGVELKGWNAPNALKRAVERVAATNPSPADGLMVQPPSATEKYIADWQEGVRRSLPSAPMSWPIGPDDAAVRVTLWGDLQEPFCAEADGKIRTYLKDHNDVRYEFRQYPIDRSCNNSTKSSMHPYACAAARAALAAGQIGGHDAYWKMHAWLMVNQIPLTDDILSKGAAAVGLDYTALQNMMQSQEIADAINQDARIASNLGLTSVPMVFINDKWVMRWRLESEPNMLMMMLDAARDAK